MELQQQRHHEASLVRKLRFESILEESESSIREINDVVVASHFVAEAFARESIQLEQGKTRDYILYNGGFADQPTSPLTVARQLPQLENVLATGAGFLVEAGEANGCAGARVCAVLRSVIRLMEEESAATREAQAAAEAAIAASKVAELQVKALERKVKEMEHDMMNELAKMRATQEGDDRDKTMESETKEEDAEKEKFVADQASSILNEHEKSDDEHDEAVADDEKEPQDSPRPLNEVELAVTASPSQENCTRDEAREREVPLDDAHNNCVSPFAFFTKKQAGSPAKNENNNNNNNNNNFAGVARSQSALVIPGHHHHHHHHQYYYHQQQQLFSNYGHDIGANLRSFSANDASSVQSMISRGGGGPLNNNIDAREEEDPSQYDTYIVNNRPFVAPRWASASVFTTASSSSSSSLNNNKVNVSIINRENPRPLYEPPSKPLQRNTDILNVLDSPSFSPQDLDWGRSVSAGPYRREEHEDAWKNHAPVVRFPIKKSDAPQQEHATIQGGEDEAAGVIPPQYGRRLPSNPWKISGRSTGTTTATTTGNQDEREQLERVSPTRSSSAAGAGAGAGASPPTSRQPAVPHQQYYSPDQSKLNDKEKIPRQFIHPADLLKMKSSASSADQEAALAARNYGSANFDTSSNANNGEGCGAASVTTHSQQFLLSEHMRNGEAQAIISVASGVATNAHDYAVDTTLDWLKRMTHGPMLQLEQTLLQRDFLEKSPGAKRDILEQIMMHQYHHHGQHHQPTSVAHTPASSPPSPQKDGPVTAADDQTSIAKPPTAPRGSQLQNGKQPQQAGKPPLAVASPPTPLGKKSPGGKLRALTKKIIAQNKTGIFQKLGVSPNAAASSPPSVKKTHPVPAIALTAAKNPSGGLRGNSQISVTTSKSNSSQQQQQQKLPSASSVLSLNAQNLQLLTSALSAKENDFDVNISDPNRRFAPSGARLAEDPLIQPPQPGQIVETEEEILEHLEKDSNYADKQLAAAASVAILNRQQQQQLTSGASGVVAPLNEAATTSGNTRSNETSSLRQIHSLLGGTQPSLHRDAGADRLEPEQVEDTTPAPFRRRTTSDVYNVKPHDNSRSEEQYFQQTGGVLHALHRVLQQETKEKREREAAAAIERTGSVANNNYNNDRSASGYYSEY